MKADLKDVFKGWFVVAATPLDIAANAVKHWTRGKVQPLMDEADESLRKQDEIIDSAHPGLRHFVSESVAEFGNKITEAADTTVAFANIPTADDIPGVKKIKQMTGIEDKDDEKHKTHTQSGGKKRRRRKTKKRALKKRHRRRKRKSRRR